MKDWFKEVLEPSALKIAVTILLPIILLGIVMMTAGPWTYSPSFFPLIIVFPLIILGSLVELLPGLILSIIGGIVVFLVGVAYFYFLSSLLVHLVTHAHGHSKFWWILIVVFAILFFGWDETIVNNSINTPDKSCSVDSDCVRKIINPSMCGTYVCANKDWKRYVSLSNSAFALSCAPDLVVCECEQSRCIEKPIEEATTPETCEGVSDYIAQWRCYAKVAVNTNDPSVCELIEYEEERKMCKENFKKLEI